MAKGRVFRVRHLRWRAVCYECPIVYDATLQAFTAAHFAFPSFQAAMTNLTDHVRSFHCE